MLLQKEARLTISKEILDQLLKGRERSEDQLGAARRMKDLKIKLMERMLGAELTAYQGHSGGADQQANHLTGITH